jgi:hypothetical protein
VLILSRKHDIAAGSRFSASKPALRLLSPTPHRAGPEVPQSHRVQGIELNIGSHRSRSPGDVGVYLNECECTGDIARHYAETRDCLFESLPYRGPAYRNRLLNSRRCGAYSITHRFQSLDQSLGSSRFRTNGGRAGGPAGPVVPAALWAL